MVQLLLNDALLQGLSEIEKFKELTKSSKGSRIFNQSLNQSLLRIEQFKRIENREMQFENYIRNQVLSILKINIYKGLSIESEMERKQTNISQNK
ncbi:hypothetical protein M2138_000421 [Dysgonomonadaceae bacterium PH5-43]|nr:hypothetical protein [Dysgonomonadaceae bacterium PH5-43]